MKRTSLRIRLLGLVSGIVISLAASGAAAIAARDYTRDLTMHQAELARCAGAERGSVTIRMDISGRGRLTGGAVVGASSDAMRGVGECVLREARAWTFQRSSSGGGGVYQIEPRGDAVVVRNAPRAGS